MYIRKLDESRRDNFNIKKNVKAISLRTVSYINTISTEYRYNCLYFITLQIVLTIFQYLQIIHSNL